ncbi:MAG: dihydrodipicolinate synthase family protein [Anaerolineae bacterium]|jgi:dihydrodipicolinate synthase/N-acetylneuraminate lyase
MTEPWSGVFAIPMTPFDAHDRIDEGALRAEIEFCVGCGVGGLVTPVMVSEFFVLSEAERRLMVRVPVEQAAKRVPVVGNCAAVNTPLAVEYARYCQEVGADAVIAMPPYIGRADFATVQAYYRAISDAVAIPIWIQNAGLAALSAEQVVQLCEEIEHVCWVKEEVAPSTHSISNLLRRATPAVHGVMGGSAGRYVITEHARGSRGIVIACELADVMQAIWNLLEAGNQQAAGDLFEHALPAIDLEGLMGMAFAKEIMVRRGVFSNHRVRLQSHPLDDHDLIEIDRVWERLQPYLLWPA